MPTSSRIVPGYRHVNRVAYTITVAPREDYHIEVIY
jgi:hypothetical protein